MPGWQEHLDQRLESEEPDDRQVEFFVDPQGDSGKTWMVRYLMRKYPDKVQSLRPGREQDLYYMIDESRSIFIFDVQRSKMEHFQYAVVESLKDRMIMSTKYECKQKIIQHVPHVLVFCNEYPDMTKLSPDRYKITQIT